MLIFTIKMRISYALIFLRYHTNILVHIECNFYTLLTIFNLHHISTTSKIIKMYLDLL